MSILKNLRRDRDSVPEKIYYNGVMGAGVHLSKHYGRYRFE